MILANLKDISQQLPPSPALAKGIEFLRSNKWEGQSDGRITIDGDDVYALIQTYETVPVAELPQLEGHRQYLDLQYVAEGEEMIGWAPIDQLLLEVSYDEAKDIWFGSISRAAMTPVYLSAGQLAVLYPSDGHLPKRAAGNPCSVKKILVKVAVGK